MSPCSWVIPGRDASAAAIRPEVARLGPPNQGNGPMSMSAAACSRCAVAWHDRPVIRTTRQRLDQLLVERGLVESRTRAQALVLAGRVRVGEGDGARLDRKPGDLLDATMPVEVVR